MSDYIKEKVEEFDGLELRTTQGRPPYDIVVNRESVHKFLQSALQELEEKTRQEVLKGVMDNTKFSTRCEACDKNSSYLVSKLSPKEGKCTCDPKQMYTTGEEKENL